MQANPPNPQLDQKPPSQSVLYMTELVQMIVDAVAGDSSPKSLSQRHLKTISLVSREWRAAARRQRLFHTITLDSKEDSDLRLLNYPQNDDPRLPLVSPQKVIVESGRPKYYNFSRVEHDRRQILDVGNESETSQVFSTLPQLTRVELLRTIKELEWAIYQDWVPQSTPGVIRLFQAFQAGGGVTTLVLNTDKIFNLEQVKYLISFCAPLRKLEVRKVPRSITFDAATTAATAAAGGVVIFANEAANNPYNLGNLEVLNLSPPTNLESCDWIVTLFSDSLQPPSSLKSLSVGNMSPGRFLELMDMVSSSLEYLSVRTEMSGQKDIPNFDRLSPLPSLLSLNINIGRDINPATESDRAREPVPASAFSWSRIFIFELLQAPLLESITFSCTLNDPEDLVIRIVHSMHQHQQQEEQHGDRGETIREWVHLLKNPQNLRDGSSRFPRLRKVVFSLLVCQSENRVELERRNNIRRNLQAVFDEPDHNGGGDDGRESEPIMIDLEWVVFVPDDFPSLTMTEFTEDDYTPPEPESFVLPQLTYHRRCYVYAVQPVRPTFLLYRTIETIVPERKIEKEKRNFLFRTVNDCRWFPLKHILRLRNYSKVPTFQLLTLKASKFEQIPCLIKVFPTDTQSRRKQPDEKVSGRRSSH
ncbi:hypothetical protein K435DRAFT_800876 [Dendrothele bispora CBS 962.96]|uniref:Uncharacterized protein n=1 Tax=Dendrothele bispora (strain CBS 962.96) TaxID=1314807 RepID=A0A4S8LRR9_DENBC|nr:hypothetical protein K435DRAFT_800876 [Dendrothele bispora CBS 962.96]